MTDGITEAWKGIGKENTNPKTKTTKEISTYFAEWCMKNKYTYYFNGECWMWANSTRQEYFTTEELYDKCYER
jgi:hypothetical protein